MPMGRYRVPDSDDDVSNWCKAFPVKKIVIAFLPGEYAIELHATTNYPKVSSRSNRKLGRSNCSSAFRAAWMNNRSNTESSMLVVMQEGRECEMLLLLASAAELVLADDMDY
jgi:hypothetical protein